MKKGFYRAISITLALIIMLVALPTAVIAYDGNWNTGTSVIIDYKANPAPSWLQVISDGVKTTGAATICYPFTRGLDNWTGYIYQLKDGRWSRLTTTAKWIPNTEGIYSACANAPEAGTYVLLGFWKDPKGPTAVVVVDLSGDWNTGKEVSVDLKKYPAPSWLQLISRGVEAAKKTKICHPFNFGTQGWIGEIRQLKDGEWIKLTTTSAWLPNKDGTYTSCATTTEAGTYALFAYYK